MFQNIYFYLLFSSFNFMIYFLITFCSICNISLLAAPSQTQAHTFLHNFYVFSNLLKWHEIFVFNSNHYLLYCWHHHQTSLDCKLIIIFHAAAVGCWLLLCLLLCCERCLFVYFYYGNYNLITFISY